LSLREGPFGDIRVPLTWSAGAALVIAAIIASALLFGHQRDPMKAGAYDTARRAVDAVAAPVGQVLSAPVRWTEDGVDGVRGYFFAVSENRRLKAQLAAAASLQDQLAALKADNERLRAVLGIHTDPPLAHVAARTISDSRGPFANTRLADIGRDRGITEGDPVLSEHGLVGRIVGVSDHVSRVLLLTDAESHTPVLLARTNGRAILAGDGGSTPKLDYVRTSQALHEGDRVLTSGDGGVFPRGLPVGTVVKGFDGVWRVALDSDAAPVDYVQILLFTDFSQLVSQPSLAPKDLPTAMTEEPSQSIIAPTVAGGKPGASGATAGSAAAKPAGPASPTDTPGKPNGAAKTGAPQAARSGAAAPVHSAGSASAAPHHTSRLDAALSFLHPKGASARP
jgi:rod shape-determining protein MreC